MDAIVLVGGFGTRLSQVLPDVPKPMAPINEKPFLAYLLTYLARQGMRRILLPVHYKREQIMDYFGAQFQGMSIDYVIEDKPLGTGGAIQNALRQSGWRDTVFVLNGDTFVRLDYARWFAQHKAEQALFGMALRNVDNAGRYGRVEVQGERVVAFCEKGADVPGLINAGVYLFQPALLLDQGMPQVFSFELDFLMQKVNLIQPRAFITDDYFIDIGIPADYDRAKADLSRWEFAT